MTEPFTSLQLQILQYLRNNIHAAETAEGVNRVWLKRAHGVQSVAEAVQALDGLVTAGIMERHPLPGHTFIYRWAAHGQHG